MGFKTTKGKTCSIFYFPIPQLSAYAIFCGTLLRTDNERFRVAKPIINLMDSKLVFFSANFFDYHFRDSLQPEMGLHFRSTSAIETGVWIWVSTRRGRQQALSYAETVVVSRPHPSAKQAIGPVLLAVPRYPPRHASGITTSRWDVVAVIVATTRAVAMLRNHIFCLDEDEQGNRCLGDSC